MEYFLTKEKLVELEQELETLKTEGRRRVADNLRIAKELGDLSENAQYIEAREEQQRVEKRIAKLEQMVRNVSIISKRKKHDEVEVGSTVEVSKNGETSTFFIVGSSEAKPSEGFISNESPLGVELMGKKPGDEVSVKTPNGNMKYKVNKVS